MIRVVGIGGSTRRPSNSRNLVEAILNATQEQARVQVELFDIVDAGPGLGGAFTRNELSADAARVLHAIESADGLVVASPVYKGSYTGLFKHLFDFVGQEALTDRPVVLAATGGSLRHALILEHHLRPLFAAFSARSLPTAVYAADADFSAGAPAAAPLLARIRTAASELASALRYAQLLAGETETARSNVEAPAH